MSFRFLYLFSAMLILYSLICLSFEPTYCEPTNPIISFINSLFKPLSLNSNILPPAAVNNVPSPNLNPATSMVLNPSPPMTMPISTTPITFGGQAVPILDNRVCEAREKNVPYHEYTLISMLQRYGLQLGTLTEVCNIHIQSEKQLVGKLSQATFSFDSRNLLQSNGVLLDAIQRILNDLNWKYNLFFFQIRCPSQLFCFRRLLRDDTDKNFGAWMQALDANAMAITQTLKGTRFYVRNFAENESGSLVDTYSRTKTDYLNHPGDEISLIKYLNALVWADVVRESKRVRK